MAAYNGKLREFAIQLFKIDAIKFGEFKTKIGLMTPVYCDLRVIISYPKLLETLSSLIVEYMSNLKQYDVICGVPYTALPIATAVSLKTGIPMLMRRKEAKDYGTKKLIEGKYRNKDKCLIIEDVVTSGSSVLETVKDLGDAGLNCNDVIVVLNREQGGSEILKSKKINMHALLSLTQLVRILKDEGCINQEVLEKVETYLSNTQVDAGALKVNKINRLVMSFNERSKFASNPIAKRLFNIIATKKTTLCIAADLTSATDILNLAEQVGPHICALKTHIDIVHDFHENFIKCLKEIAKAHNFILFEDRKYADIGETVRLQYTSGIYKVSSWAQLVTAHSLIGGGMLDAFKQVPEDKGVFLLAETSAANNLINDSYTTSTIKLAADYPDLVVGIVCQSPLFLDKPGLLQLTPGVKKELGEDNLGQRYNSPEAVVIEKGGDIAVVGRGITKSSDPGAAAKEYKCLLWDAYTKRISS